MAEVAGLSLVELLVVMGLIAFLSVLLVPAVREFQASGDRRGATTIVMGALEQARAAALESGLTVYVGFADADFPDPLMRYSAFVVFRECTEEERADDPGRAYVVLRKWTRMPGRTGLKSELPTSLTGQSPREFPGLAKQTGTAHADECLPAIAFNGSGAVEYPADTCCLRIVLYEGCFEAGRDRPIHPTEPEGFDEIRLAKYTGRARRTDRGD